MRNGNATSQYTRGRADEVAVYDRPLTAADIRQRVALGALKALEDGGGLVLRAYEPHGARGRIALELPAGWSADAQLDLLERETGAPDFELGPFAVRSWSVVSDS